MLCKSILTKRGRPQTNRQSIPTAPATAKDLKPQSVRWLGTTMSPWAVDAFKSAEIELGQNPIHVARVQATASKDRYTVFTNRGTLHQILNLRKESGSDLWSRTGNVPACQQHNKKLLLPAETAAIHQTVAHYGSLEDIGPFPHIKLCGLLQQHILGSHERCPTKIAIRSQRGGQADHEHKEIWPHHACAQGSTSLASHPPTNHFQNCNLCS